jgi:CheY-like chemotaxis protein
MVAVSDNGVGLDQETQARIFDPFFTTKELGNGTGLGLSVVYGIVKQSGGHITVHSEPGHGATFKIYLPPVRQAEARIDLSPAPPTLPEGAETILLVEDDESVRRVTRMMLEKQGYTVLEAENGHEALRLGDQYPDPINLLFTDIMMPGLSCQEMLAGLTTQHPEIKVLFMSGHTDNVIVNQGVLDSGVAFIQKPFRLEQLAFKVREVLDAPAEG